MFSENLSSFVYGTSIAHVNLTGNNNDVFDHSHYTELACIKDCFIFKEFKSLDT